MHPYSNQMANTILETQQAKDKLSHAYLFIGNHEQDGFALYAAQAILCKSKKIGACGLCSSCTRVANHQHGDFTLLSGKTTSIKKDDIIDLQRKFTQTSMEESNHKVYIIEDVDNASISAMNALLKFLEEPEGKVTAILTSSSEQRVLQTIQSRCLIIKLKENASEKLFHDLVESEYDLIDAYYLSKLFPTLQSIEDDKNYNIVSDFSKEFIAHLNDRQENLAFVKLQAMVSKHKKIDREGFLMFLSMLELSYGYKGKGQKEVEQLTLSSINKYKILEIVIDIKDRIRPGVNLGLLVDQFVYQMSQGVLYD